MQDEGNYQGAPIASSGRRVFRFKYLSTISCLVDAFDTDAPRRLAATISPTDLYLPLLRRYPQLTQPDFSIANPRHGTHTHLSDSGRKPSQDYTRLIITCDKPQHIVLDTGMIFQVVTVVVIY
ncbi:hypothetical protein CAPTEDRAFT_216072 [Capitella teleta]|uniref:Uncharacterized protein n=1 Tax=Capitella teleta TaxID=283909 RepID=R7TYN0_CAPTE|nr:hypothetical protein CAPTEDRAFT_216072 [Capitella teleta]|eukprot:ELT96536.1 hypothetical protein CAPTEDRAFT_216072 [Capitella teleta]